MGQADEASENAHSPPAYALAEGELARRVAFLGLGPGDLSALQELRALFSANTDRFAESFYAKLQHDPDLRALLPEGAAFERLKRIQREHFLSLTDGRIDEAYAQDRLRIGLAHARVGVAPKWYLGAYQHYLSFCIRLLQSESGTGDRFVETSMRW